MADKKTFLMYKSWNPMLENLPYEKLGELMYSILLYQDGEENVEPTDPMVAAMFAMIKNTMEEDADKYAETCAKRSENGKQGGRPKKQEETKKETEKQEEANALEEKPKKANGFSEKQTKAKKADTDNDTDNDLLKKKNKQKKKADVDYEGMLRASTLPAAVIDKVLEWVQYKQERKEHYVEIGFKSFITQITGYVRDYGADKVIEVITKTMSSNYKGVVWDWLKSADPKTPTQKKSFNNFKQNDYDFEALEKELLSN